ncbi:hypothetical protein ACL7TT_19690 [Microbulbifer sp. 2304DJ12-6]|uniref:hypothetical protein n=1 Tax=Microbulbifer sp. 2304DJ12-6 TaxID=3233340 RepID=UPI0039B03943
MTTNVTSMITMDVTKDNAVLNIALDHLPVDRKFGGGSWMASSSSLEESRIIVLRYIFGLILRGLVGFKLWLLMGHSAFQPDNRITRHRKLWGSMKARGAGISHSGASYEEMIEHDGKLKYFGAKELSELSVESVVKAISEEHCAYLAILPEFTNVNEVIDSGWTVDAGFDKALLYRISNKNGLLLKSAGEFDDPESGFVAIGDGELLKKIIQQD